MALNFLITYLNAIYYVVRDKVARLLAWHCLDQMETSEFKHYLSSNCCSANGPINSKIKVRSPFRLPLKYVEFILHGDRF